MPPSCAYHMGNGQPKAACSVQADTEGQSIVDTACRQRPRDAACTIPHPEHAERMPGRLPKEIAADAGYGSEQSCAWPEMKGRMPA